MTSTSPFLCTVELLALGCLFRYKISKIPRIPSESIYDDGTSFVESRTGIAAAHVVANVPNDPNQIRIVSAADSKNCLGRRVEERRESKGKVRGDAEEEQHGP